MSLDARAAGALVHQIAKAGALHVRQRMTSAGFPDLTSAQVRLLALMDLEETGFGELARLAGVTRQAHRHAVDRLSVLGYAQITTPTQDARARKLVLTEHGRTARIVAQRVLVEAEQDWSRLLEPTDWATLAALLNRLASRMDGHHLAFIKPAGDQRARRPRGGSIAEGAEGVLREVGGRATTKEIADRLILLGRLNPGPRASTVLTNSLIDNPRTFVRVARGTWELVGSSRAVECERVGTAAPSSRRS